jgi:hypothetical protein
VAAATAAAPAPAPATAHTAAHECCLGPTAVCLLATGGRRQAQCTCGNAAHSILQIKRAGTITVTVTVTWFRTCLNHTEAQASLTLRPTALVGPPSWFKCT